MDKAHSKTPIMRAIDTFRLDQGACHALAALTPKDITSIVDMLEESGSIQGLVDSVRCLQAVKLFTGFEWSKQPASWSGSQVI